MDSDNYNDSYFAVDSNRQNMISSNGRVNLLLYQQDRIIYTESSFRFRTLYEYSFVNCQEHCYNNLDIRDMLKDFLKICPMYPMTNISYLLLNELHHVQSQETEDLRQLPAKCQSMKTIVYTL